MINDFPPELLDLINSVKANRPKTVLQHILEHGAITTEELTSLYGYNHPPRADRDVREHGIPLKMERVPNLSGRSIARYSIDVEKFLIRRAGQRTGRRAFPAAWKRRLVSQRGFRCEACLTEFSDDLDLQVDHRVPYEIGGDPPLEDSDAFMLVCASCNREKSWTCEHCPNWGIKDVDTCQKCFWANPTSYSHVGMIHRQAVVITFSEPDQDLYHSIIRQSTERGIPAPELIKEKLKEA